MAVEAKERVRAVAWDDPEASRRDAATSGLDYLLAIRDGRIPPPPAARLVGYRLREVEPGRAVFELDPAECHYSPFATVHGGILATVLDSAMTAAVLSTLGAGAGCVTLEMKMNFIRPVTERVPLVRCEARVVHAGSSIATAEARLTDAAGKLYAHGVETLSVSRLPAGAAPAAR